RGGCGCGAATDPSAPRGSGASPPRSRAGSDRSPSARYTMARRMLELIGNTPLVRVDCFDTHGSELWLKLESHNPGGSIKDRIGLSMIAAAEADGRLRPGGHIVEATAGNTGLGLALVAALRGY